MDRCHIKPLGGGNPVLINSSLVSAQNRNRNYWANWDFGLPEDKGILLKDILETPGECYEVYNRGKSIGHKMDKAHAILSRDHKGWCQWKGGMTGVMGCAIRGRYGLGNKITQQIEPNFISKANCITTVQKDSMLIENQEIRPFTMIELERLQTLPDGYTSCCSKTQRCKQIGNGWTVDVIVHILKSLKI